MSVTKTIGGEAGRDFATVALALAAIGVAEDLPLTFVDDVLFEIHSPNADGSAGNYGAAALPNIVCGNFKFTIKCMVPDVLPWTYLTTTGGSSGANGWVRLENISGSTTNTNFWLSAYASNVGYVIKNCQIHVVNLYTTVAYQSANNKGLVFYSSAVFMSGATPIWCKDTLYFTLGHMVVIHSSLLVSSGDMFCGFYGNAGGATNTRFDISNSTAYAGGRIFVPYTGQIQIRLLTLSDSILCGATIASTDVTAVAGVFEPLVRNACLFSRNNPGYLHAGLTLADWLSLNQLVDYIAVDPQFVNAGGTAVSDYRLSASSPCRRLNQALAASPLYSGDSSERLTMGALSGFDENPLSESLVLYPTAYGNGKTGRWQDVENVIDVRLGTQWGVDGASRTGTLDLNADAPTVPTLTTTDDGDETATATISGADAGTTNTVYYAAFGASAWTEAGAVEGNGSVALDLGPGAFLLQGQSKLGAGCSATVPALFRIKPVGGEAALVTAAEDIKNALIAGSFSQAFTPERVYIDNVKGDEVKTLSVFIQPAEIEIENGTRAKDKITCQVDIGIFNYCKTLAENDAMLELTEEIYKTLRHRNLSEGQKVTEVSQPALFNPANMREGNVFAALITVTVTGME